MFSQLHCANQQVLLKYLLSKVKNDSQENFFFNQLQVTADDSRNLSPDKAYHILIYRKDLFVFKSFCQISGFKLRSSSSSSKLYFINKVDELYMRDIYCEVGLGGR